MIGTELVRMSEGNAMNAMIEPNSSTDDLFSNKSTSDWKYSIMQLFKHFFKLYFQFDVDLLGDFRDTEEHCKITSVVQTSVKLHLETKCYLTRGQLFFVFMIAEAYYGLP